jgi:hypothetical protein
LGGILFQWFCIAQEWSRGKYGNDPIRILQTVVDEANDDYEIQETALDWVTNMQWAYPSQYKITNTLEYFRNRIQPYLQRVLYIWLTSAVILLIYNWFLMVTNSLHKEWDSEKVKKNIINIAIGVIVLTWFYFILQLMVAIINTIFGWFGWGSGFS